MNVDIGPLGRLPKPVAVAGVVALVSTIVAAKGARRLIPSVIAGLHIGLPIRWYFLAQRTGASYESIADARVAAFSEWLTSSLLSLPDPVLVLLVGAAFVLQGWRVIRGYDKMGEDPE